MGGTRNRNSEPVGHRARGDTRGFRDPGPAPTSRAPDAIIRGVTEGRRDRPTDQASNVPDGAAGGCHDRPTDQAGNVPDDAAVGCRDHHTDQAGNVPDGAAGGPRGNDHGAAGVNEQPIRREFGGIKDEDFESIPLNTPRHTPPPPEIDPATGDRCACWAGDVTSLVRGQYRRLQQALYGEQGVSRTCRRCQKPNIG